MIRFINDNDIKEVYDIFYYYVKNTSYSFESDELNIEEYTNRVHNISKTYPFIVYEEDNIIKGFAYLSEFNYRRCYQTTADLTIYIKDEYRGKGIGYKLYYKLEEYAKLMGIKAIISLITSSNINSMNFHKKLDFNYLTTIDKIAYKFKKWCGLTYYIKYIDEEAPINNIIPIGDIDDKNK